MKRLKYVDTDNTDRIILSEDALHYAYIRKMTPFQIGLSPLPRTLKTSLKHKLHICEDYLEAYLFHRLRSTF